MIPEEPRQLIDPRPVGKRAIHAWYEHHREDILRDLVALGEKAMLKKWGISQATWYCRVNGQYAGLALRWGVKTESSGPAAPAEAPVQPRAAFTLAPAGHPVAGLVHAGLTLKLDHLVFTGKEIAQLSPDDYCHLSTCVGKMMLARGAA